MGKVLDIIIKIFLGLIVLFLLYCFTIGRDFGIQQINKIRGMYYVHVGDKAFKEHRMQDAIDAYQTGLDIFPQHYEAWLNLGNIFVAYEDYFSATQAYQNAILAKDNYTVARMNLGIITAEKLGDFDSAIMQYQSIVGSQHKLIAIPFIFNNKKSETANKAIAYYNMGRAYSQKALYLSKDRKKEKKELLGKAAVAYENAVQIIKDNYDMNYNLALTYHLLGDYRKAGEFYCKAIDAEPMNYEAHYNLGLMLKHLHEENYAIDELEKAAVLSASSSQGHSKYIFDVLSSVSMEALQKGLSGKVSDLVDEQMKNQNSDQVEDKNSKKKNKKGKKDKNKDSMQDKEQEQLVMVHGKVSASDESDTAIVENFRRCNSRHLFEFK